MNRNDSGKVEAHREVIILTKAMPAPTSHSDNTSGYVATTNETAATTADDRTAKWTSSPASVMVALARGVTTVLIHDIDGDFDELVRAISQYYPEATVLQWDDEHSVVKPFPTADPAEAADGARQRLNEKGSETRSEATMSARSLVTEEELALLTQRLTLDEAYEANQSVSGETSGEEGREPF